MTQGAHQFGNEARATHRPSVVPDHLEAAALFMCAEPGMARRALASHARRADGNCACCRRSTRWPCTTAFIALRAEELARARRA